MAISWTNEQKAVITTRGKNILVSAAAGSGKTAVLVERILSRITSDTDPVSIDELLIVTFTKAAAGEMKNRILSRLEDAAEQDPDNAYLADQVRRVGGAQITTITASAPMSSGITASPLSLRRASASRRRARQS